MNISELYRNNWNKPEVLSSYGFKRIRPFITQNGGSHKIQYMVTLKNNTKALLEEHTEVLIDG